MNNKQLPPKAVSALVFGILSIVSNVFAIGFATPVGAFVLQDLFMSRPYGGGSSPALMVLLIVPSLVFAVVSLYNARRGEDAVKQNPELYRGISMLKAARVTAYIGAILCFATIILIWVALRR